MFFLNILITTILKSRENFLKAVICKFLYFKIDFGVLHRNELTGALSGLSRVRRFCQG